jgi:hypothetical protein
VYCADDTQGISRRAVVAVSDGTEEAGALSFQHVVPIEYTLPERIIHGIH